MDKRKKIGKSVLKKPPRVKAYKGELLPPSVRKTTVDLVKELKKHRIAYMVIGAVPVQFYGRERFSRDVDFALRLTERKVKALYDILTNKRYKILDKIKTPNDLFRAHSIKVEDLETNSLIDLILKPERMGLGTEAYKRRRQRTIDGEKLHIPSPEDYLISKLTSRRPFTSDYADIVSTLSRQYNNLDWDYLEKQAKKYDIDHLLKYYKEGVGKWVERR